MNLFATSPDPRACAEALDDKRVVKMVLETAQLLNNAMVHHGQPGVYKPTHQKHPCSIWVSANWANYAWAMMHFEALLREYTHRYGKTHKCAEHLDAFRSFSAHMPASATGRDPFPNCTAAYKHVADVHEAYKYHLLDKWNNDVHPPRWTKSSMPRWIYKFVDTFVVCEER